MTHEAPYAQRRATAMDHLDGAVMILAAAPVTFRSRDTTHRYRADSELFYLTGWAEPDTVAVLRPFADEDRFVLFVRDRNPDEERWTGPRGGPEAACERFGADAAYTIRELDDRIPSLIRSARAVYMRPSPEDDVFGAVAREIARTRMRGSRTGVGPRSVVDPGVILDEMRLYKDAYEAERIREACRVTVEAFTEVLPTVREGMGEWEVEARLESAFRVRRATGPAFSTIAASGSNATTLHYESNGDRIAKGALLLLDAGAEVEMYCGDVTRTIPASGRFAPEQRVLHEIVSEAHRAAVEQVTPGRTVADVHDTAVAVMIDGLRAAGLLAGTRAEILEHSRHRIFCPHQTSHWLGLDVHDVGSYRTEERARTLEPGMALTVEPGLYVPDDVELHGSLSAFRGLGVRLEDDLWVTESGAENLTGALPLETDAIEGWLDR